jgi:hypothetical protein
VKIVEIERPKEGHADTRRYNKVSINLYKGKGYNVQNQNNAYSINNVPGKKPRIAASQSILAAIPSSPTTSQSLTAPGNSRRRNLWSI